VDIQNTDLLKGILIRLRARPAKTGFRWVKGHDERNYGNNRADELADTGREQEVPVEQDEEEWIDAHPALQNGARLQALEARHTYSALIKWHSKKIKQTLRQETLDEAKDGIQRFTGLRPTNEKLLNGIRTLEVPQRVKDHMRNMLTGKIKCGTYWNKIPGYRERANCPFCKRNRNIEVTKTEEHLWLECDNSGQAQAWHTAHKLWRESTNRNWPDITIGMIRGAVAISLDTNTCKDLERLITITIWTIWKSKLKISINNQDVDPNEMTQQLKELLSELSRKSWDVTRFMEGSRKVTRQRALRTLWANKRLTKFDPISGPHIDFS
jgi:hypothetical protein